MPEPSPETETEPGATGTAPVQAPELPSSEPATSGRDRLRRAFLKPHRGQVAVGLLMVALGFAAATQVRSTNQELYAGYREDELIEVLRGLTGATQRAQDDLVSLQETRDQLKDTNASRQAALEEARDRVDTYNILAGLVPVKGPGISMSITEGDSAISSDTFLNLIQELRTVGAEAIEVNDKVRLVAQSWISRGEGSLIIDGQELTAPYKIEAIGEPETLRGAVVFTRGPKDELESEGASVLVATQTSVTIEAITTNQTVRYAVPSGDQ